MNTRSILLSSAVGLLALTGCLCPFRENAASPFSRESIEWQDLWIEQANVSSNGLPRVLMIGDSISRQYRGRVSQLLAGKATIANSAGSRCVGDPVLTAEMRHVLSLYDWDVIHFNNGLHGESCDDAAYETYFKEWVALIRGLQPRAKLVWATTTTPKNDFARRVAARNASASRVLAAYGDIAVDDLGVISREHPEYICADNVHFNEKGVEALAAAVAASIERQLPQTR